MNTIRVLLANGRPVSPDAIGSGYEVVVVDGSALGDGAAVVTELVTTQPDRRIVVLVEAGGEAEARRVGAAGYVPKRAAAGELAEAIRVVAGGGTYPAPADAAHQPDGTPALSERETEVVRFVALGYSNKEIAAQLKLSVKTVETYKTRSMEKLNMRTRVDIVRYAVGRGWFQSV